MSSTFTCVISVPFIQYNEFKSKQCLIDSMLIYSFGKRFPGHPLYSLFRSLQRLVLLLQIPLLAECSSESLLFSSREQLLQNTSKFCGGVSKGSSKCQICASFLLPIIKDEFYSWKISKYGALVSFFSLSSLWYAWRIGRLKCLTRYLATGGEKLSRGFRENQPGNAGSSLVSPAYKHSITRMSPSCGPP